MKRIIRMVFSFVVAMMIAFNSVECQTVEEQARNVIANVEGQIRAATDDFYFYWYNLTDFTRHEILKDIQKSWEYYGIAKADYGIGIYNSSLEEAYWAIFMAHRSTYRIFLDLAKASIEQANLTLNTIPSYIPQPTEARQKLEQANELYSEAFLSEIFQGLPSTELAPVWINGISYAENKLYYQQTNVVRLANEAYEGALDWIEAHEMAMRQTIEEQRNSVVLNFYAQLLIPLIVGLLSSLLFLSAMFKRLIGWLRKKSNRNIIWDGKLTNKKWDVGSIVSTLATLTLFWSFSWVWRESVRGLARTYEMSIPVNLLNLINATQWTVASLLVVLFALFVGNLFKWQKGTGILFTSVLIAEIILCLVTICLCWLSLGQIYHPSLT